MDFNDWIKNIPSNLDISCEDAYEQSCQLHNREADFEHEYIPYCEFLNYDVSVEDAFNLGASGNID